MSGLGLLSLGACSAQLHSPPPASLAALPSVSPVARTYSKEAWALKEHLRTLHKSPGLALGHQDSSAYGVGWTAEPGAAPDSDVLRLCGRLPLVLGFDLGGLERGEDHAPSRENLDGVPFALMREQIRQAHLRGQIVTVSYHGDNPQTGGNAWDTKLEAQDLLQGQAASRLDKALGRIAQFFESCRDEHNRPIPVLFRPLHEQNGAWFWWGTRNLEPEEQAQLYRHILSELVFKHGQEQLLFAYSPDGGGLGNLQDYMEAYPGDNYVDLLGLDLYWTLDPSPLERGLNLLAEAGSRQGKPYALTEFGPLGSYGDAHFELQNWWSRSFMTKVRTSAAGQGLSYALAWRNARPDHAFLPWPGHPAASEFVKSCEDGELKLLPRIPDAQLQSLTPP